MKKFIPLIVSTIVIAISTIYFTREISLKLKLYNEKRIEIADEMSFKNRMLNVEEYFSIIGLGTDKEEEWALMDKQATRVYKESIWLSFYFLICVLVYYLFNQFVYRKKDEKYRIKGLIYVFCSMTFLYLGLNSPFIEIEAYNSGLQADLYFTDYTFEGRVYYLYQNKSVLQLIKFLYLGGNFTVAIIILAFSIIFPIIKLVSTLMVFLTPNSKYSKSFIKVINALGKWSMADVMVASIFLAIFSFANSDYGIDTGSSTLIGMHFFIAFVVLSIISGIYLKKYVKFRHGQKIDELYQKELKS